VAGSTFFASGAAFGDFGLADLLESDPQAAMPAMVTTTVAQATAL
jgi:hypothetical protein